VSVKSNSGRVKIANKRSRFKVWTELTNETEAGNEI
jgi:hypothetical protein